MTKYDEYGRVLLLGPYDRHYRRSGEDYASVFVSMLPQGQAWSRDPDSTLVKACTGLSLHWGYVDGRAADFLEIESDPRKTVEMLDSWERAWGLPDPCFPIATTQEERRRLLVMLMTWMGAQSRQYFIDIAAWLGYTITIDEFAPFMCGISRCGITLDEAGYQRWEIGAPEMRFYWRIHMEQVKLTWFRCGAGECGVDLHLIIGYKEDLECLMRRWKPAQTEIVFDYSGVGVTGTSVTENEIGVGLKTFETQADLAFGTNMQVRVTSTMDTLAWMEGTVTEYVGTSIAIDCTAIGTTSGTFDAWTIASLSTVGEGGSMAGTP